MRELLRAEEAAARLRLSRSQVYLMVRRGDLPSVRFGERAVRIPASELEEWLRRNTRVPADPDRAG